MSVVFLLLAVGVALRKESVDRNPPMCFTRLMLLTSLSARRAWIEISPAGCWRDARRVALRKESVDRNKSLGLLGWLRVRRSPQGERG